jgi:hypothetical protein
MRSFEPFGPLIAALRTRPAHAYLIGLTPGQESEAIAAIKAALLCWDPGGPCGRCPACVDDIHPDWIVAGPADHVRREAVADWPSRALVPPLMAARRVFLVAAADRLTDEAANLLLKLVEEPPPSVAVVLASSRPESVLATLKSRARWIRTQPAVAADADVAAELFSFLAGDWSRPDWMDWVEPAAWSLRQAIRSPGSVQTLDGVPPSVLLSRWQALEEAAVALAENANRDLVRHRLERAWRAA